MTISATVRNSFGKNDVSVTTEGAQKEISIGSKPEGFGSAVNGGELLFLSLATCFCNDIYREAAKRKLKIQSVSVRVTGKFGKEGEPATDIVYQVNVIAQDHSEDEIKSLIEYVDKIAEVHNTLRQGANVRLQE